MAPAPAEKSCTDCPIRYRAVCARCDADELRHLEEIKYYRHYESGQPIAWAGEEMPFVASVVRGAAKISQSMDDGRTQMLGLLLPSDFIGSPGRAISQYDVTAVSDISLCCFRRKPFEHILATTPHIAERLLSMTLDELDAAREWMLMLGRKTAREKIATLLAIIARRETALSDRLARGGITLELPLTREATADYLGLTIETVSRQISALKRDGVIQLQGTRRVLIPDVAVLLGETGDSMEMALSGG